MANSQVDHHHDNGNNEAVLQGRRNQAGFLRDPAAELALYLIGCGDLAGKHVVVVIQRGILWDEMLGGLLSSSFSPWKLAIATHRKGPAIKTISRKAQQVQEKRVEWRRVVIVMATTS